MPILCAKAAVNAIFRVDHATSFTPMSLSSEATVLVSGGGVIPSFIAARLKLPSCAIMTMRMLTSIGFLFCTQTFLDEFGEQTPRALAISHGLRNVLSLIRIRSGKEGRQMGKTCRPHQELTFWQSAPS